jgi:hypothetical protein
LKKIIFCFIALVLVFTSLPATAAQKISVEMLYMNHGPLLSTLKEIDSICAQYKDKVTVSRYDFESPEGERFMAKKGIHEHIPLMIWIDGKYTVSLNGKEIKFIGFPTGSGPAFFQGKWTMEDLRKALNQTISQKK